MVNREFDTVKLKQYDSLPEAANGYPSMLDFSIHNTCNLECVMCYGEFSSSIRLNREKLPAIPMVYDAGFVRQLEEFIPHASQFVFAGGEPFLIEIYYDIWEQINRLNPTDVHIVTNGTILNKRVRKILQNGKYHITHSLESLNAQSYNSIRRNADLDRVMENMEYFQNYCRVRGTEYAINLCPIQQNWREVPEFVKFCNEKEIKLYILTVVFPPGASLMALPAGKLKEIAVFYEGFQFNPIGQVQEHNVADFKDLIARIKGWEKYNEEFENRVDKDKDSKDSDAYDDITSFFALVGRKVKAYVAENPEVQHSDMEQALARLQRFRESHGGRRMPKGKLAEMDNLTADALMGMINGSTDEEFGLILRDHVLR